MTSGRISLLSIRGRAALVVTIATIVAVLAGPVMPAHAAPAPAPLPGPANLLATYPVNGFYSMVVSWDAAAPHSSEDIAVESYELRYADDAGDTITAEYTAPSEEFAKRSAHVNDLGYDPTLVELRAGYSDDSVSEWSQLEVTLGSLAHLSAEIDWFADEQGTETTTLSSRLVFEAALARATALVAEGTAVGAPVGAAYEALVTAAEDRTNYSGLLWGIERVEAGGIPVSTPALLLRLSEALASTRALLTAATDDPTAQVTGEEIELSVNALGNAYYAAVEIADPLAGVLAAAEAWLDDPSAADYTSFSQQVVRRAVAAAHTALKASDATSDSLDAAAETIEAALAARLARPTALVDAFALYDTLDMAAAEYTSASAASLAAAHAVAIARDRAKATSPSLTAAGESLSAAIASLADLAPLRATITAKDPSALDSLLYTGESWKSFAKVHQESTTFLTRAAGTDAPGVSAEEIRAVQAALEDARFALKTVRPLLLSPGLFVDVISGQIRVTNPSGTIDFAAGQFGYNPSIVTPPVLVPTNPGMQFTPPPPFFPQLTIGAPQASPGEVDCTVRRVTYCNRMAAPELLPGVLDSAEISEPAPLSARAASFTTGSGSARAAAPMAVAAVAAAAVPTPATAATGGTIVTVLPPTTPVDGELNVAIALPADALTGTLAFQYTYNGVYYETAATIDIVPPFYAYAADSSSPAQPTNSPAQLALSGADSTTLFGAALLLITLGALLGFRRPRRTRQV